MGLYRPMAPATRGQQGSTGLGLNFLGVSRREAQSLKTPSSLLDSCRP